MANKTARWLDLIAYLLQHRFPVTREEIFGHVAEYREDSEGARADTGALESLRRKFERDKDELRTLGIHIETVPITAAAGDEPGTGYRLRGRDFYLPYLELTDAAVPTTTRREEPRPYQGLLKVSLQKEDVRLLDRATRRMASLESSPLAAAATSARRKLAFDLPLPLDTVERLLAEPLGGDAARSLEVLQQAVAGHVAVGCRYYAIGRDAEEPRTIEPYGLFFSWGRWYCVARCRARAALRVFRLDRMREARRLTGGEASFAVPPAFSIHDYVGRAPWELSPAAPVRAVVRFAFPESRWVLARGVGTPVDALLDDGGASIAFDVHDSGPFLRWLLTFRSAVTVQEPESMARDLAALRRRVADLYAGARA